MVRRAARRQADIWTETHEPTGRMQRLLGPLYVTGRVWFQLCSVGTRWLPYGLCLRLSWVATAISWLLLRRVRRGITSNLNVILGDTGFLERERRVFRTFRMFSNVTIDRYALFHRRVQLQVAAEGRQHWEQVMAAERGCVLVSAHFGNWEVAALVPAMLHKQIHVVREPEVDAQSQALLNELYKSHESQHFHLHYAGDEVQLGANLLLALRRGGVVGLSGDQPRTGQRYVEVESFGRATPVPHGPFALARAAEVPVLPVFGIRIGRASYRLIVCEPIHIERTPDRDADVLGAAQAFADAFGQVIRQSPHSWFCWWPRWAGRPARAADA